MRNTIYNSVHAVKAVNVTAISANGNTDGTSVNLDQSGQDFRSVGMLIQMGAYTDGTYTLVPQESADNSSWSNVPADRVQGSAVLSAENTLGQIGVIPDPGTYPYIRIRVTAATVTSGGTVCGQILLGSPTKTPVAHS
ncbi:MAG: hypothetical protein AB7G23_20315 [Vicinamibacterales bacterium]